MARPDETSGARPEQEPGPRPSEEDLEDLRRRAEARDVEAGAVVPRGEGSQQDVRPEQKPFSGGPVQEVWDHPAPTATADATAGAGGTTYYDRPTLKEPTWIWTVPTYFFAGGAAGASAMLGAAAQLADRDGLESLVHRARWIGTVGAGIGVALLIADLGRPERFFNMLRVFRASSPMSVGSWTLAAAGSLTTGSAVMDAPGTPLRPVGDALGLGAGVVGLPLSTYTAVLLSHTAVPLWQQIRRSLPALFASSAVASSASILDLLPSTERESRIVRAYGIAGRLGELVAARTVEREASRLPRVAAPLHEGVSGALWRASEILNVVGLALSVLPTRRRGPRVAAAVAGIAGGLTQRFALMRAGKVSSMDPRATFQLQRAGLGAAEVV
jgi:formate-dependent nitrite reductase membrane component NrfD